MTEVDVLAGLIKQKRIEKGISQSELTQLSNVDEREIQEFEALNYPDMDVEFFHLSSSGFIPISC